MKIVSGPVSTGLKITHDVVTVALLAITMSLLIVTFSTNSDKMPLYLTSTYYTTYYTNQPTQAWAQPTDPIDGARVADTFYGCLQVAGVGTAPPMRCGDLSPADYANCLRQTTTSADYIINRANDALAFTQAKDFTLTPSMNEVLTRVTQLLPKPLGNDRVNNAADFGLVQSYLASVDTDFARRVYDAVKGYGEWQGIAGCIDHLDAGAGTASPLEATYDRLWQCASRVLPTTRDQALAFQRCVPLSAWPALDELQSVYSPLFLGSYNRLFLLIVAAWIVTSFGVYTLWMGDSQSNLAGKPVELLGRTGIVLAGFCALWNAVGATVLVSVSSFQDADQHKGLPMTLQTVLVSGLVVIVGSAYFLQEFWEQLVGAPKGSVAPAFPALAQTRTKHRYEVGGRSVAPLAGYARIGNSKDPLNDEQSAPLLVAPWSDVWLLTDGLILLGILGTSPDVVTAEVGRVFLAATYAAAGHSAIVRLLYEAYYSDAAARETGPGAPGAKGERDNEGIRIMLNFAQMAILGFVLVACWLIFQRYAKSGLIVSFVLFALILPMVLWFVFILCVEFNVWPSLSITDAAQVGFIYHALIRIGFVAAVLSAATADADKNAELRGFVSLLEA